NRLFVNDKLNYISKVFTHLKSQMGLEKYSKKYTDYTNWLKNYDRGLINRYVLSKDLKLYEYVDYDEIKNVLDVFFTTGKQSILDKMGFCLRKTRTISFREKKSHPLEQLYQVGNVENKVTILMNISVSKCRTQIWNTLEVNNNPFVKTLYDYGRNNTLNFDN